MWLLIVSGERNSAHGNGVLREGGGFGREAVGGDHHALIVVVEKVEGVGGEFEAVALADVNLADQAQVGGNVVGPGEGVAAVAGKSVVVIVAILIGIAGDGGVDGASAAGGDDAGYFPVVEDVAEQLRVRGERGEARVRMRRRSGGAGR